MSLQEIATRIFAHRPASAVIDPVLKAARDAQFERDLSAAGTDAYIKSPAYTAIQKHGAFFDTNFDHRVSVDETRQGLRDLGQGNVTSAALAPIINLGLGPLTHPAANQSWLQKLKGLFTINLDTLVGGLPKGGNGAFDSAGKFDPAKFEHMMSFDTTGSGSLSQQELFAMVEADAQDASGKSRTKLGFGQLMSVASDTQKTIKVNGVDQTVPALSRARLQSFYDGTIFFRVAAEQGHPHALVPPKA